MAGYRKTDRFFKKPQKFHKQQNRKPSFQQNSDSNTTDDFFVKPGSLKHTPDSDTREFRKGSKGDKHQRKFNTKSDGFSEQEDNVSPPSKKPFDKKTYRLKKYSKKYKIQQWEDKRRLAVMRQYYKSVKGEPTVDVSKIYEESEINEENDNNFNAGVDKPSASGGTDPGVSKTITGDEKKKKPFEKVKEEVERIKLEKQQKREEFLRKKAEKEEARKRYKKEKVERFKKLSRRTKKGQPIMKDRIEMLLEKIQKNCQS